ncbi:hypothetical protein AAVH_42601 [Aphelenchoides avenae]|nr:hypothetical protein AAVH_42601 [Aphelenchus avenae]
MNLYGFCLPIVEPENYEERSRWVREMVAELAQQLLAAKNDVLKKEAQLAAVRAQTDALIAKIDALSL